MKRTVFTGIAGILLASADVAGAVTEIRIEDLFPPQGRQHLVEIKFDNSESAYFDIWLTYQLTYNAYFRDTGEYYYGNDLEGEDGFFLRNGVITSFYSYMFFDPKFEDGTLSFWFKSIDFLSGPFGQSWGCSSSREIICQRSAGFTNMYISTGGQNVSVHLSRLTNVPEPAAWAMMISGFGLIGTALRRRRALPA